MPKGTFLGFGREPPSPYGYRNLFLMRKRHGGRWNATFCDGHGENLKMPQLWDFRKTAVLQRSSAGPAHLAKSTPRAREPHTRGTHFLPFPIAPSGSKKNPKVNAAAENSFGAVQASSKSQSRKAELFMTKQENKRNSGTAPFIFANSQPETLSNSLFGFPSGGHISMK
jgi:prepilin-type processing-associated H-X9-DG protein